MSISRTDSERSLLYRVAVGIGLRTMLLIYPTALMPGQNRIEQNLISEARTVVAGLVFLAARAYVPDLAYIPATIGVYYLLDAIANRAVSHE